LQEQKTESELGPYSLCLLVSQVN